MKCHPAESDVHAAGYYHKKRHYITRGREQCEDCTAMWSRSLELSAASVCDLPRYRDDSFFADMDALDDFRKMLQFETLILRAAIDE